MGAKHVVVEGATLKCKFSESPQTDILLVKSQSQDYANDKDGAKKRIASDMDIGQTLEKNSFGKCKLQPTSSGNLPCQAVITKWSNAYKNLSVTNKGKVLVEDSKATCPIGGPDCIEVEKHGQKNNGSKQESRKSDDNKITAVNPLADNKKFKEDEEQDNQIFAE
jgi:Domain of unknown function (DUF4280)